jgi:hypothetical protein
MRRKAAEIRIATIQVHVRRRRRDRYRAARNDSAKDAKDPALIAARMDAIRPR